MAGALLLNGNLVDDDNPLAVEIVSGGAGGGTGTEYTEGDTDTTITGQALLWEDADDTLRTVSDAKPLPVQQAAIDPTVDAISPYALSANLVSGRTAAITSTTATTVVSAPGASLHLYITHILIQNSHATVSTWVNVTEETSGTVLYSVYAPALGGGASITLPAPLRVPTANKALQVTCVTTGANVQASASGYKAA